MDIKMEILMITNAGKGSIRLLIWEALFDNFISKLGFDDKNSE